MIETRYFITKDFIGYPTGIAIGKYKNGKKVAGDFVVPCWLNKYKGFGSIEEIKNYKMCSCGKSDCDFNKELMRIVNEFNPAQDVYCKPFPVA